MDKKERENKFEEIKSLMRDFTTCKDKENHFLMRFHRCYLDGSYGDFENEKNGENLYNLHVRKFSKNLKTNTLINEALLSFRMFLSIEFMNRKFIISKNKMNTILDEVFLDDNDREIFIKTIVNNCKNLLV